MVEVAFLAEFYLDAQEFQYLVHLLALSDELALSLTGRPTPSGKLVAPSDEDASLTLCRYKIPRSGGRAFSNTRWRTTTYSVSATTRPSSAFTRKDIWS